MSISNSASQLHDISLAEERYQSQETAVNFIMYASPLARILYRPIRLTGKQLKDIFKRPAFFSTCVFGVMFVLLGTAAMNALSFGIRIQEAADRQVDNFTSRGIAIAVVTFAVILHGTWRQAGLFLNNTFATIKVLMLLLIIITGLVSWGGAFHTPAAIAKNPGVAASNFSIHNSFKYAAQDSSGFAESFLAVIFAYGGFNQANYVSMGQSPLFHHLITLLPGSE